MAERRQLGRDRSRAAEEFSHSLCPNARGHEPLRDRLKKLDQADWLEIGRDLQRAQYRRPVGMPLCRPMGNGLREIRTSLPSKTIARTFLCHRDGVPYALHGFVKKTQKTLDNELKLVRKRQKDVENG